MTVPTVPPDHPGWVWGEIHLGAGVLVVLVLTLRHDTPRSRVAPTVRTGA